MSQGRLRQADADAILPVSIGTGLWLIALMALIAARVAGNVDVFGWIGVAAVGLLSGLGGIVFLRWRKGRGRAVPST